MNSDEQVAGQISSDPQLILESRSRLMLQSRRIVIIVTEISTLASKMCYLLWEEDS